MRGVVALDHHTAAANPRDNSAPGVCVCIWHTLRGVVPRASFEYYVFGRAARSYNDVTEGVALRCAAYLLAVVHMCSMFVLTDLPNFLMRPGWFRMRRKVLADCVN